MKSRRLQRRTNRAFICFLAPSLLGVALFVLLPFLDVFRRSFTTAVTGEFAGIGNYQVIFHNSAFRLAVKNTLLFTGCSIPLLVLLGLGAALLLDRLPWGERFKTLYLFPLAMPTATIVLVWQMVFAPNGLLNRLLTFGLQAVGRFSEGVRVDYLGTGAAFFVLSATYIWKNLGYTVVLWLCGLRNIPQEVIEAARVDGAGAWQRFCYVKLPGLKGSLYTIVVLSFLNSFKIYREAFLVAGAYPNESIYLLQHLFNNWFVNLELDKMAAGTVVIGIALFVGILALQRLWDRK